MSDSQPFDPAAIGARSAPKTVRWTSRDCMLYALGVGAGTADLQFTTDNTKGVEQRMVPTMPVTLGVDFSVLKQAGRFDWAKLLHADQRVEILGDIPVEGEAQAVTEITEMWDKDKAALIVAQTTGTDADGRVLWRSSAGLFIRGVGGWGGARGPAESAGKSTEAPTDDSRITTLTYETHPDQALIYRLSGDRNPLHSDPAFAARAGLDHPILHGLCTFGFAGRAALAVAGKDATLRSMSARFAGPVWPGDTLTVDLWHRDDTTVGFRMRGRDDKEVLTGGLASVG
ncbi:MaoC/PaaZ C-terminal domain-containing protein (plasmid) [Rhodococcus opacus]|jgi:acyl dehydratase|uniref:MaoC/PaaZ C-terminal domain-containing protein n=1 Tax=Rhodococcus opacus TaxID=37919 RepID=A0AAX3YQV6_RHOOP|nr:MULTISPECIES: MaoC family dehydratase [Rhodococcus]NHU45157.1 3-hydroxyacyl-thioester dehydratase [Rhodococcus sp. A14]MCZ4588772.1 MaoC/PaaZ C-terminal domain-containing protein [Rhodococcus opacus]QSE85965.1 MaoC family dehydratase N-terminal domain-containing protein [Rhodococcus koreensis]UZG59803.1 MaoC/PaaZ C-terminal domain-containing protein [Rhodococcus opacus]WKN61304.1 MaoC/PaaZ C-terminal domain-containing protein [Rhodococcus opacus]